jgi:hypothetical protein
MTFSLVNDLGFNHLLSNGNSICAVVKEDDVSFKASSDNNTLLMKMDLQDLYEIGVCCLATVQGSVDEDSGLDLIEGILKTPEQVERTKLLLKNLLSQLRER